MDGLSSGLVRIYSNERFGMSQVIKCPVCRNEGKAAKEGEGAFEMKGRYRGKAVVKCNKCGKGLLVGLFSGTLLGKPKIIFVDEEAEQIYTYSESWAGKINEYEHIHSDLVDNSTSSPMSCY